MYNEITVTFDKTQEDIPTLVVCKEVYNPFSTNYEKHVVNVIVGNKAVTIWNELINNQKGAKE